MLYVDEEIGTLTPEEIELIKATRVSTAPKQTSPLTSTLTLKDVQDQGLKEVWFENLRAAPARFTHKELGGFRLEPHGRAGSIVNLDAKYLRDPWIQRAEKRGAIRFITESQALELMDTLDYTDYSAPKNLIRDYLTEEAQDKAGHRYVVDGLPEQAEMKRSIPEAEVWANTGNVKDTTKETRTKSTARVHPQADDVVLLDGPILGEGALGAPEFGDPVTPGDTPKQVSTLGE